MNADFTAAELAFQSEVREFLAIEFPAELKQKVDKRIRLSTVSYTHLTLPTTPYV